MSYKYIDNNYIDNLHTLYESVFNTMGEAIIVANEDGKIIMANQHSHKIWGYDDHHLIGKELTMLMPKQFRDAHNKGMKRYITTNEQKVLNKRLELEGLHSNGRNFPIQLYISETVINNKRYFTAAIRDITDIDKQRKELERTQDLLLKNFESAELKNEELMHELQLDPMTRLFNHTSFIHHLKKELERLTRSKSTLSLLFFDIDDFKLINDKYGHLCGDKYLLKLSFLLSNNIGRANDIVSRYGGEEFAIILPDTSLEGAILIGEKLRKSVENYKWPEDNITVTVGAATTEKKISCGDFINQADKALYHGKQTGKNKVTHWKNIRP